MRSNIRSLSFLSLVSLAIFIAVPPAQAQGILQAAGPVAVTGEKITYNVSFGKLPNVGYAELHSVSRGRFADIEAVELRGKFKTLAFFSAAFYSVDETRTVFADAATGVPLYISSVQNGSGLPRETIASHLAVSARGFDLITLIYKIRYSAAMGSASLFENGRLYGVTIQAFGSERIKTEAGEFETTIVSVQSDYLTELGLKEFRINLANGETRVPARFRFKTSRGEFIADAASVQLTSPPVETVPIPVPVQTPGMAPGPRPAPTPMPYIDNQPLAPELAFSLGESLEYAVNVSGQPVGNFRLTAAERKLVDGRDTLLLRATATRSEPGNRLFVPGDAVTANVSPETLAPRKTEIRFSGALSLINQTVQFDPDTGRIISNGTNVVDGPIGTHSLLSLLYALRSFNLRPSRDSKNPVNDTRVAVFWENQPYIFTIRPSETEAITLQGQKVPAQKVAVNTGNAALDQLNIKVWLGNDERRLPLRIAIGLYEADLIINPTVSQP